MKILFIGSLPNHVPGIGQKRTPEHEPMFRAAHQLGYEAAVRNHAILVGSDSPNTIDLAVVNGFFKFCTDNPDKKRHMEIHRPNDARVPYQHPPPNVEVKRFYYHQDDSMPHKWIVTHVRALDTCNCIVAVGGGASTRIVGNLAADRQTPIVAVATFGGTAQNVFDRLLYYYKSRTADPTTVNALVQPWENESAGKVIGFAEILAASSVMRSHLYFLSYNWNDLATADHMEVLLWRNGRTILRDEINAKTGGSLSIMVETLIQKCDTFLAMWGSAYKASSWCPGELQYAADLKVRLGRPKRIVLCSLDDTSPDVRFANTLRTDCRERAQREFAVFRLLREET